MNRCRLFRWAAALPLVFSLAAPCRAAVVYVNKNAPGTVQDGKSWGTAFQTVQAGVNAAANGDEVWVAASSPASSAYSGQLIVTSGVALYGGFNGSEKLRVARNWKQNITILDGHAADWAVRVSLSDWPPRPASIDGFVITNTGAISSAGGVHMSGTVLAISNTEIVGTSGRGCELTGGTLYLNRVVISRNGADGVFADSATLMVADSTIADNGGRGVTAYGSFSAASVIVSGNARDGVAVYGAGTLSNIHVVGNLGNGLGVYYGGTASLTNSCVSRNVGDGIVVAQSCQLAARNNTVCENGGTGLRLVGGAVRLSNTISAFNGGTGVAATESARLLSFSHNDAYGNTAGDLSVVAASSGVANITIDPQFLERANADYHLKSGSPCVDAGDDLVVAQDELDLDGNVRVRGAHVDIGAYEASPPPTAWYKIDS